MVKLWAEILFKFQWQIEKLCPAIDFGPGLVSISLKHCELGKSGIYDNFSEKKD